MVAGSTCVLSVSVATTVSDQLVKLLWYAVDCAVYVYMHEQDPSATL